MHHEDGEVLLVFEKGLVLHAAGQVRCPTCDLAAPLTALAKGRDAFLSCADGHVWRHAQVSASAVRQIGHEFRETGALTAFPAIGYPTVDLVPCLAEPSTLAPAPAKAMPRERWEIAAAARSGTDSIFRPMLMHARRIAVRTLPWDGHLYARLCPSGGGNAEDAHMSIVVLALAGHAAAQRTNTLSHSTLKLKEIATMLLPPVADVVVRRVRPRAGLDYLLRVTDLHRLEHAPPDAWARWRQAACDLVTAAVEQYSQDRNDPEVADHVTLGQLPHQTEDHDLSWYAPQRCW
ncbi:hypothetical protein C0Q63_22675 [Streptomyces albidoflavus]|nr:hypothetical protein C0Q63_22675 [Streptomyces albidoflavus]